MSKKVSWVVRHSLSRGLLVATATCLMTLWSTMASATITQGDFSVFGKLESKWSGRWGEGSARGGTPTTFIPASSPAVAFFPTVAKKFGTAPTRTGGNFDFNHWDLVQARQLADIRPDYHIVKNFNFLGRLDTLVLKDADVFAVYRPWYDAFPDIKHRGVAQTARDWASYSGRERVQQFVRDDLREYYGQLNFTDNFSMRVGKQQIIWSEADALSGTEVTNPTDLSYHWTHFESAEDQRINLRMVKFNYILPDFLKTANNEIEAFVIPGDWEHGSIVVNTTDARSPYEVQVAPFTGLTGFNQFGQPFRHQTLSDDDPIGLTATNVAALNANVFVDGPQVRTLVRNLTNSLDNSEFGVKYSTLLPIGNGLQTSLIYLYEARSSKLQFCENCPPPPCPASAAATGTCFVPVPFLSGVGSAPPGVFIGIANPALAGLLSGQLGQKLHVVPPIFGNPRDKRVAILGSVVALLRNDPVRQHYLGLTGTYYDKDLTDIVYRYDVLFAPKVAVNVYNGGGRKQVAFYTADPGARWTEQTRWIIAGDRPTYLPWISKQHTFITMQNVVTWYPSLPLNAVANAPTALGKVREVGDLSFLAFTNWLINGQLTAQNVGVWDWDDNVGYLSTSNSYRYSRNILMGLNGIWYMGRSGRFTDPFIFSRDQRINEVELRFTYEI